MLFRLTSFAWKTEIFLSNFYHVSVYFFAVPLSPQGGKMMFFLLKPLLGLYV